MTFNSSLITLHSSLLSCVHPDVRRHAGQTRADLVELYDGRRISVEDEAARARFDRDAELLRGGDEAVGQLARHLVERAREAVGQRPIIRRILALLSAARRDMTVEQ